MIDLEHPWKFLSCGDPRVELATIEIDICLDLYFTQRKPGHLTCTSFSHLCLMRPVLGVCSGWPRPESESTDVTSARQSEINEFQVPTSYSGSAQSCGGRPRPPVIRVQEVASCELIERVPQKSGCQCAGVIELEPHQRPILQSSWDRRSRVTVVGESCGTPHGRITVYNGAGTLTD